MPRTSGLNSAITQDPFAHIRGLWKRPKHVIHYFDGVLCDALRSHAYVFFCEYFLLHGFLGELLESDRPAGIAPELLRVTYTLRDWM